MLWANINGARSPPSRGLRAECPVCLRPVIAKCGERRIQHWAHLGERTCDQWWEPETEWHRTWKRKFPDTWHECIMHDVTGEKHIADVRTPDGVVIEFQHSHLRDEERSAREHFYRDMLWVVDGLRLRRDLPRFENGARDLRAIRQGIYTHPFVDELFPTNWLKASVPVFFDFGAEGGSPSGANRPLWCLLPQPDVGATVLRVSRETFIQAANERAEQLLFRPLRKLRAEAVAMERRMQERERLRYVAETMRARRKHWRYGRRWR